MTHAPLIALIPLLAGHALAQPLAEVETGSESFGVGETAQPVRANISTDRASAEESDDAVDATDSGSRIHVTLDLTYTSQYFFRGIIQEDDGLIIQPSIDFGFDLYESDSWSLSGNAGIWTSFHDEKTGSSDPDDFVATWYEADFYAGLSLTVDRVTAALLFCTYASPNDAFGHIDELSLTVALDDSGWFGPIAVSPYATLALELSGQGDGGSSHGTFLALGVEPAHTYEDTPIGELTVSLPIEAGFSLDDYYENAGDDESFGYFTAGLAAELALPSPEGFGDWSLHAGVDFLLLGDATEAYNSGDDSEWIAHAGISIGF